MYLIFFHTFIRALFAFYSKFSICFHRYYCKLAMPILSWVRRFHYLDWHFPYLRIWPTAVGWIIETGQWVSCIRVVDSSNGETTCYIELPQEQNECAISLALVNFRASKEDYGGPVLAVGTVKSLEFNPRGCAGGCIYLYKFINNGPYEI